MLLTDKVPYLLTILFLAFGWTITQISTDLAKSPVISYCSYNEDQNKATEHTVTITNISSEKLFTDLTFTLRPEDKKNTKCIAEPEMLVPPPTELKSANNDQGAIKPECVDGKFAEYSLAQFQPGASVQLIMRTDKKTELNVHVRCNEPVRLIESSVETFVIKNRLLIMMWSIPIWAILIIIYAVIAHCRGVQS